MAAKKSEIKKRAKSKNYSVENIAEAVGLLNAGNSVQFVSDQLGIPQTTVSTWKSQFPIFVDIRSKKQKKEKIDQLVAEILEEQLIAMKQIAKLAQDITYIKQQDSDRLAILFGVIADKSMAIFRASERAAERERQEAADSSAEIISGTTEN